MPAPPANLWPRNRCRGLGPVRSRRVLLRACSSVGHALREAKRAKPKEPKADPLLELVAGDVALVRLIGKPEPGVPGPIETDKAGRKRRAWWPDDDAPAYVRIERGTNTLIEIGFRGAKITTETHRELGPRGRVIRGDWRDSERLYCFEAFKGAIAAAQSTVTKAGCVLGAPIEVRQNHGGQSAIGLIYLKRVAPALSPARPRGPILGL